MSKQVLKAVEERINDLFSRITSSKELAVVFSLSSEKGSVSSHGHIYAWPGYPKIVFYESPTSVLNRLDEYLWNMLMDSYRGRRTFIEELLASLIFISFILAFGTGAAEKLFGKYTLFAWIVLASIFFYAMCIIGKRFMRRDEHLSLEAGYSALSTPSRLKFTLLTRFLHNVISRVAYACSSQGEPLLTPALSGGVYYYICRVDESNSRLILKLSKSKAALFKLGFVEKSLFKTRKPINRSLTLKF